MTAHAPIHFLAVFKALAFAASLPAFYLMTRKRRESEFAERSGNESEEPIFGTSEDLERAEREVAKGTQQRKAEIGTGFVLLTRFGTRQGFSETDARALVTHLRNGRIDAKWIFEDLSSPRDVRSMRVHGIYSIYVAKSQLPGAEVLVNSFSRP